MTLLTPEIIEAGARAMEAVHIFSRQNKMAEPPCTEICRYGVGDEPEIVVLKTLPWAEVSGLREIISKERARACLTASLPGVMEACAKVADEHRARVPGHDPDKMGVDLVAQGYGNAALNIAFAIRALSPHSVNQEGE